VSTILRARPAFNGPAASIRVVDHRAASGLTMTVLVASAVTIQGWAFPRSPVIPDV
jgi:hypothetical protein